MQKTKNILTIILIAVIIALASCSADEYARPDIDLTPVYSMTEYSSNNNLYAINVYREKPLLIRYDEEIVLHSLHTEDYVDNSDSIDIDITLTAYETRQEITNSDGDKMEVDYRFDYEFTGTRDSVWAVTGTGTTLIQEYDKDGNKTDSCYYTMKITEDEVYN